jgi:hypothetical protein
LVHWNIPEVVIAPTRDRSGGCLPLERSTQPATSRTSNAQQTAWPEALWREPALIGRKIKNNRRGNLLRLAQSSRPTLLLLICEFNHEIYTEFA